MRPGLLLLVCCALAIAQPPEPPKYNGPGSCASPSCHGSVQVRTDTNVQQNEYSIWVVKDRHARAYAVLANDVAKRITRLMSLNADPQKEQRCLVCHSLSPPDDQRAKTFTDFSDGVSCESCHGPASNWLGKHTEKDWKHEQSVALGMKDLRDPAKRAENCLECHIGTQDRKVDHELIAAGHPDLVFEMAAYEAAMPKHWTEMPDKPNQTPDPWFEVRSMAVGEAVELQSQLQRAARNAQSIWPEYADLDCFACHHSLTDAKDSWQQARGYPPLPDSTSTSAPAAGTPGRRPGNPPWNVSRFVVLREVINEINPEAGRELASNIDKTYAMITALNSDRSQVVAQANATAEMAGRLAPVMMSATYDQARVLRMMKAIIANSDYITRQGERPAEQSAMVLQVLYTAYSKQGKPSGDARIQESIAGLFKQVENPSAYNAFKFADGMRALGGQLP